CRRRRRDRSRSGRRAAPGRHAPPGGFTERCWNHWRSRSMAEVTQQQVVEYIKGISVLELSQLVKTLESELGVSAAAAMPMGMPAGGGAAAAAPAEEKTDFTVTLT